MDINDTPTIDFLSQPSETLDPFHLDLDPREVVRVAKDSVRSWAAFYAGKKLRQRQERNKTYFLGQQPLYKASNKSKPYKENIIYEAISRAKPIDLSRLPDLTVKPGDDSDESKESAEQLTGIFNSDIKKRANRKLLGLADKQEPIYFYSVIKARWNPEKGPFGDYEFTNVHPDNVVWDHNCTTSDANDMRFVGEKAKLTLKEVIMMFPDKEQEIKEEFGWSTDSRDDEERLASPIDIWEFWFHWYKLKDTQSERVDGVLWLYGNTPLKTMKNPYFDYQGRKKTFSLVMKEKESYSMEDIFSSLDNLQGEEQTETVYNNYFQDPEKPYFFMVYENMGEHPISETSRIEQVLEFQDALNMDGSIIQDMNLRSRGKLLFDSNSLDQATVDNMNLYDVDQGISIDIAPGQSLSNSYASIEQKPATQQQYKSMADNRGKAFEMMGVGETLRGLADGDITLGQQQMSREGDYTVADDRVEDTINACAEWQARWSMQFIKLFYTKPHMRHILGKDGEVLHARLTQDMVDDGMEVVVSASAVDKVKRVRIAMENAKLGLIDPLTYFEDTEQPQAKERAKRLMTFKMLPQMYMQEYVMDSLSPDNPPMPGQPVPGQPVEGQQPPVAPDGQMPMGGGGEPLDIRQWKL